MKYIVEANLGSYDDAYIDQMYFEETKETIEWYFLNLWEKYNAWSKSEKLKIIYEKRNRMSFLFGKGGKEKEIETLSRDIITLDAEHRDECPTELDPDWFSVVDYNSARVDRVFRMPDIYTLEEWLEEKRMTV